MKGQTGTEHGANDDLIVAGIDFALVEWCLDGLVAIRKELTDLVCFDMSDADNVLTETHTLVLDIHIAQLCQEGIEDAAVFAKIDYFHEVVGL